MRVITSLLLILLLVLCPIVCGASDSVCATHLIGTWTAASAPDRSLDQDCCPEESDRLPQDADDCLCKEAIQTDSPRAGDGDHDALPPTLNGLPFDNLHLHSRPLIHLARSGSSIGWASRLGAALVCAVLQTFRC